MHPQEIANIQYILQMIGYSKVIVSGQYDDRTYRAVMDFQRRNNMMDDGELNPNTAQALYGSVQRVTGVKPQVVTGSYETPSAPSYPLRKPIGVRG